MLLCSSELGVGGRPRVGGGGGGKAWLFLDGGGGGPVHVCVCVERERLKRRLNSSKPSVHTAFDTMKGSSGSKALCSYMYLSVSETEIQQWLRGSEVQPLFGQLFPVHILAHISKVAP